MKNLLDKLSTKWQYQLTASTTSPDSTKMKNAIRLPSSMQKSMIIAKIN